MINIASWFIILTPILGLYLEDRIGFGFGVILTLAVWGWCLAMASGRPSARTPIHAIYVRIVITVWIPFGIFIWYIQDGGVPRIFTFWEMTYTSFGAVAFFVILFWGILALGRKGYGNGDEGLNAWESAGGHYFWDMVPWPWNPDSHDVRNGGGWVEQAVPPSSQPPAKPTSTSVPSGYAPVQPRRK